MVLGFDPYQMLPKFICAFFLPKLGTSAEFRGTCPYRRGLSGFVSLPLFIRGSSSLLSDGYLSNKKALESTADVRSSCGSPPEKPRIM